MSDQEGVEQVGPRQVGAALEAAGTVCALLDGSGTLVWANDAAAAATGRPHEELVGTHAAAFFAEDDHERVAAAVAQATEAGYARLTADLVTGEGETAPYEFVAARVGEPEHGVVVFGWPAEVDAETTARQAILERMAEGFLALTADGEVTYLNERAHVLLSGLDGRAASDDRTGLYGRSLWDLLPDTVADGLRPRYREAIETGEPTCFELHRMDTDRFFEGDVYPSESGVSVYVREVTDRRRAARQRQRSERALRRLYRVSADPDLAFGEKLGRILDIGRERLDLPIAFLTRIDEGVQTVVASRGEHPELVEGESCPLDEAYCRRTIEAEEPIVVSDAVGDGWADDPAYERFGLDAYVGVKVFVAGELYGTLCFAAESARPIGFGEEERTFVELLSQWVRYELERRQNEAALRRQNERLEEFAALVSHDLRNPLNVAQGNVELAKETGETERLDAALDALARAEELVGDVLALARQGRVVEDPEAVDLSAVANAAWASVADDGGTLDVTGELTIAADRERVQAMLENLFRNSVEHGTADGTVHVEVGPIDGGFYVADDGPGIPEADAEQVFDHGFTTNEDGTGLGLSIVRSIAEAHGWRVELADSEGARFEFHGVESV